MYTDGSRIDGGVGAGVAIYQDGLLQVGESYKLSPWASVYQAELVAIVKGLELLNACNVDASEEVRFYTDSMSSLKALSNSGSQDHLVALIHTRREKRNMKWFWVKAHVGTTGTEHADSLAKAGTEKVGIDFHVKLSFQSCKNKLRKEAVRLWQTCWDEATKGRKVLRFLPKVSESRSWTSPYVNWFVSGHGPFPLYCQRFKLRRSRENCHICNHPDADGIHVALFCNGTAALRTRLCPKLKPEILGHYLMMPEGRVALGKLLKSVLREFPI